MRAGSGAGRWSAMWKRLGTGSAVGLLAALLARDLDLPTLVSYPGDRLPLLLPLVALGVLAWRTRLQWLFAAGTLALALVWGVVALSPVSLWMVADLERRDPPRACDAVFVLASRLQVDGEPTTAAMARLVHALGLLGEGRSDRLILSELAPPAPSYAVPARALMGRLGLAQELVTVGPVRNTRDEAVAVASLCRRRGWRRILVVTSPYHARRASGALEREGIEVVSSPAGEPRFDLETLDRPEERLEAFGALLHEHVGIWVYRSRGWIAAR